MMIATARATSGRSTSRAGRICRRVRILVRRLTGRGPRRSDFHDFGLFVLQEVVDRLRVTVGELLHPVLGAMLVVRADLALRRELLQVLHRVSTNVSHCDPPLLRDL